MNGTDTTYLFGRHQQNGTADCIEVVKRSHISKETIHKIANFAQKLVKHPVLNNKRIHAFVVNSLSRIIKQETRNLVEQITFAI